MHKKYRVGYCALSLWWIGGLVDWWIGGLVDWWYTQFLSIAFKGVRIWNACTPTLWFDILTILQNRVWKRLTIINKNCAHSLFSLSTDSIVVVVVDTSL